VTARHQHEIDDVEVRGDHARIGAGGSASSYYERIVDVMEELVRITALLRPHAAQLVDRYSERKAPNVPVDPSTDLLAIAIRRP